MECHLTLFVSGASGLARRATDAAGVLSSWLSAAGVEVSLDVVDVLADPARAESARVIATPTLVRASPPPERRVIGDLSGLEGAVHALRLDELGVRPPAGRP